MLNKKVFVSLIILLGLVQTGLKAQDATTATGGVAKGSGGSVSYSVGQTGYTTHTSSAGTVAQGVQQPYEISVLSGINEAKAVTLNCVVYPNPTTDHLQLKVVDFKIEGLSYQLFDTRGRQIANRKVIGSETTISMKGLAVGTYFLKVINSQDGAPQQEIKTFKIIKN